MRNFSFKLAIIAFLIAVLGLCVTLSKSRAQSLDIYSNGDAGGYSVSGPRGVTIYAPLGSGASPLIIAGPDAEGSDGDKKWMAYCKPTFRRDDYGVTHYVFSKVGCEFGRDSD